MKLGLKIKLVPSEDQRELLKVTLERCNSACNKLSLLAFESNKFHKFDLQKIGYADVRSNFGLSAQATIRCISKVAEAYASHKKFKPIGPVNFRNHSAQPFDERIIRFKANDIVSIWTIQGRILIKSVMGADQRLMLAHRKGQVDLILDRGHFFLNCVIDIEEAPEMDAGTILGVDLGIINIAADSDGSIYSGANIQAVRQRLTARRSGLQKRATKAAKRKLRALSGKQKRFQKHENHCISKALVQEAQRSGRGIGLEDLRNIRNRVKASRGQRDRLSNWSFAQLRAFVCYKAKRVGVPVIFVEPAYTSQRCSCCGLIDKRNRPNQATFSCIGCSHSELADINAARNIKLRAEAALSNPALSSARLVA